MATLVASLQASWNLSATAPTEETAKLATLRGELETRLADSC